MPLNCTLTVSQQVCNKFYTEALAKTEHFFTISVLFFFYICIFSYIYDTVPEAVVLM